MSMLIITVMILGISSRRLRIIINDTKEIKDISLYSLLIIFHGLRALITGLGGGIGKFFMFSSAVKLADLDDFLNPAQDCVVSIVDTRVKAPEDGEPNLIREGKVNLSDCLACSGCVTTAEAILVQSHSHEELNRILPEKLSSGKLVVVSLSRQSASVIAAKWKLSVQDLLHSLRINLKTRGINYVITSDLAELLYHKEIEAELKSGNINPDTISSPVEVKFIGSQCPGWVCYAEKQHTEDDFIQYMSKVPPIQQWQGLLVKTIYLEAHNKYGVFLANWIDWGRALLGPRIYSSPASGVYHVTVEPCYDKKLESVRPEFQLNGEPLCDLVLGTNQFLDFVKQGPWKSFLIPPHHSPRKSKPLSLKSIYLKVLLGCLTNNQVHNLGDGSLLSSSGYAAALAQKLSGNLPQFKAGINPDHSSWRFGTTIECQTFTGLRNMPNLIKSIKRKSSAKSRVFEALACPKGCLNGGAHSVLYLNYDSPLQLKDALLTLVSDYSRNRVELGMDQLVREFIFPGLSNKHDGSLIWRYKDDKIGSRGMLYEKFRFQFHSLASTGSRYKW